MQTKDKPPFRYRNQGNIHLFPRYTEKNTQGSSTVPDQTLTIRELVERSKRGIPVNVRPPEFHTEDEQNMLSGKKISTLDLSEIAAEIEKSQETFKEADRRLKSKMAEDSAKKEQEAREKWLSEMTPEELERRFKKLTKSA